MTEHAVVIAGGGPTGLMLAGELALAGIDVAIVERRASHELPGSRAGGMVRVIVTEPDVGSTAEPTLRDVSERMIAVFGTDYGIHSPTWITRFTDATRQAASYRKGRIVLAGDAAHIHSPVGGQGLNLGVQDAVNLGWKLAQVVKGISPDSLLDSYHAERHPVAARVLRNTMAQVALMRVDDRIEALLGRRMPDLDLITTDGPRRVFSLLHRARPVLLNLGEGGDIDASPWADRIEVIDATFAGVWELPVIGAVTAPSAVLIRPDGHVAWVGDDTRNGLTDALTMWFGLPTGV